MKNRIVKLSSDVVSKIAAGQVVESPFSVVKELVENSIDANAKKITIEIENSGLSLIRVVDDGEGMDKQNLMLASLPHTTSKISSIEDLVKISSIGFRGEALSSISSVANIRIKSRIDKQKYGFQIEVKDNKVSNPKPVGMQVGTIIEVTNLFAKVPARRKSIKSETIEKKRIVEIVTTLALAYPDLSIDLFYGKKLLIQLPSQTQRERNEMLLGKFISAGLIPIKSDLGNIIISGYIGTPQLAIKQKSRQFLYVNQRPVRNDSISSFIKEEYSTLLDPRLHPCYLIFIDIEPDLIDVNVHPRKEEVIFLTEEKVYEALEKAIKQKLQKNKMTYNFEISPSASSKTAFVIKDAVTKWSVKPGELASEKILQVDNTFLITQTNSNLLVIDQHAAHERILYEEFVKAFNDPSHKKNTFELEKTIVLDLPKAEMLILEDTVEYFNSLGFELVKDKKWKILKAPLIYKGHNINQLISEVLNDLRENNNNIDSLSLRTLSFLACKSAIKSGDELRDDEAVNLIDKLYKTNTNYTCPHGRPVIIEIPLSQLHIAFRRR